MGWDISSVISRFSVNLQSYQPKCDAINKSVHHCALTVLAGIGAYVVCETIGRTPFIVKFPHYLPIHSAILKIERGLLPFHGLIYIVFSNALKGVYTKNFHTCLAGPIQEELVGRFFFQKLILKDGIGWCFKKIGVPLNQDSVSAKVFRIGLSALVFAAGHTWAFSTSEKTNPYGAAALVYLVVMGGILGTAQELTNNTLHPIAIHVINNSLTVYISGPFHVE